MIEYNNENFKYIIKRLNEEEINFNFVSLKFKISKYCCFPNNNYNYWLDYDNKSIDINNIVTLENLENHQMETYKIVKCYYKYTPKYISRYPQTFGDIIYKKEILNEYSILNNEISDESLLGKKLLGKKSKETILLKDDNLKSVKYKIVKIV